MRPPPAEASSGVRIDLLFDARGGLTFVADDDVSESSLLKILQRVDTSFERAKQTFRAVNRDGYLVDLIKPMQSSPWKKAADKIGSDPEDLTAVQIERLDWLQNSPAFEATAINERRANRCASSLQTRGFGPPISFGCPGVRTGSRSSDNEMQHRRKPSGLWSRTISLTYHSTQSS
ncbi:hypothetical protein ACVWWP_000036 [Bradyrhizobium sp. LM3.6]